MRRRQLTPADVRKATTPGHFADGMGLYLQVSESGTKSWVFRYMLYGRQREMGLGSAEVFSLGEAREKVIEARKLLHDKIDPIEARLRKRDEARAEATARVTFLEAATDYIELHKDGWRNARHRQQWENTLRDYAYPALGSRPVSSIDGAVITEALASIWTTKSVTAARVKQRIEKVCQWIRDGRPLPVQLSSRRVQHHAALPFTKMPAFMAELRAIDTPVARALEFTILTAARTGEVLGAQWNEIKDGVWTIPASRMKAGRQHEVPLSPRALEVLGAPPPKGGSVFGIFHGDMLKLLGTMRPGITVHGFRSSFRDWAGDRTAFAKDIIEHALTHSLPSSTEKAYRRETALPKRRKLMEAWARYCSMPAATDEDGKLAYLHG
jgi:integrase